MTYKQEITYFAATLVLALFLLMGLAYHCKTEREQKHAAILAAHAYTIKIPCGKYYETHYVKKGDYRIEDGILYFRAAGKQHVAKENYIISEN